MMSELAAGALDSVDVEVRRPPFDAILRTTWRELSEEGLIHAWASERYGLTGNGWLEGLRITKRLDAPAFRQKMSQLAASLKRHVDVDGRREDAFVYLDSLAGETSLSQDFIFNAIESRLLDHEFNMRGAYWESHHKPGTLIRVPLNFGMEPL
ncbi:MAG: hypothetical protein HY238_04145 [Acidobacteria bacterium]|nr:hypothetical protein [Acidobacteriota bacterium]